MNGRKSKKERKKKKKECPVKNDKNGEIDSGQSNLGNGTQSNGKIENQKFFLNLTNAVYKHF